MTDVAPPQSEPPPTAPTNTENDPNIGNVPQPSGQKSNSNDTKHKKYATDYVNSNNTIKNFTGTDSSFGMVIGLRSEKCDAKTTFEKFRKEMGTYYSSQSKVQHAEDTVGFVRDMEDPFADFEILHKPKSLSTEKKEDETEVWMWKEEVKAYLTRKRTFHSNKCTLFNLIWGQCTPALQGEVTRCEEFSAKLNVYDILWLLDRLKEYTAGVDARKGNSYSNLHEALLKFFLMRQGKTESNDDYLQRFNSMAHTVEIAGGSDIFFNQSLFEKVSGVSKGDTPTAKQMEIEQEKFKAVCFIKRCDPERFRNLHERLITDTNLNMDVFPKSVNDGLDVLVRETDVLGNHWNSSKPNPRRRGGGTKKHGVPSFTQTGKKGLVAGKDGKTIDVTCYNCNDRGHIAPNCPKPKQERSFAQIGMSFVQPSHAHHNPVPYHWLLLDSCSTVSVVMNPDIVTNIRPCSQHDSITIISNGGQQQFEETAALKCLPLKVHFNAYSMANILSLKDVANIPGAKITMDTSTDSRRFLLTYNGLQFIFNQSDEGLFYFDTNIAPLKINSTPPSVQPSLLQSVNKNSEFYTRAEIDRANNARAIQQQIGFPTTNAYKRIIGNNVLENCDVTLDDVARAEFIYGKPVPLIKGTTVRALPPSTRVKRLPLPSPLAEKFKSGLSMSTDFLYVNGLIFLITHTRDICFKSVVPCTSRSASTIIHALTNIVKVHHDRGLPVTDIFGDNEFDKDEIKAALSPASITSPPAGGHVGDIEASIKFLKNKCRTIVHSTPFKKLPKAMTVGLVRYSTHWTNIFPVLNGVSDTLSPAQIVLGSRSPNFHRKKIAWGAYAVVYIGTKNDLTRRGVEAIALYPSNIEGSYYFMNIHTGRRLHSAQWNELPISSAVIDQVHALATSQNQKAMIDGYPMFEWSPGVPVLDDGEVLAEPIDDDDVADRLAAEAAVVAAKEVPFDYDAEFEREAADFLLNLEDNYVTDSDADSVSASSTASDDTESVNSLQHNILPALEAEAQQLINEGAALIDDDANSDGLSYDDDDDPLPPLLPGADADDADSDDDDSDADDDDDVVDASPENQGAHSPPRGQIDDAPAESPTTPPTVPPSIPSIATDRQRRSNAGAGVDRLSPIVEGKYHGTSTHKSYVMKHFVNQARQTSWSFLMNHKAKQDPNSMVSYMEKAMEIVFTQMSATKGIRKHGETAVAAILKEFRQLHEGPMPGKPVVAPVNPDKLSKEELRAALEAVNLIKEKRDGRVKGRTCANGSKQRRYLKEGETISSPTISTEALLTTFIIDAFEDRDIAIFDVPGAYLHAEMPEGKQVLLVLRGEFVDIMCQVDPSYKDYVTVKNGKKVLYLQILRALYGCIESALLWYDFYVNVLKGMGFTINPYDRCVANKMINGTQCTIAWYVDDNKVSHRDDKVVSDLIEVLKGHFGDLTISRGKAHDFLGMNIKVRSDKKIEVEMKRSLQEAIDAFDGDITTTAVTPACSHLFTVDPDAEQLDEEKSENFHSVVAKLLYIAKRARPDIETAVAFLCTRVSKSDTDDWKKLKRLLQYIYGTIDEVRVIGASSLTDVHSWVDAAYAVHSDMRSHTGGGMSMGYGLLHSKSSKQKLNTKSSTEAEVVGASDYLPYSLWLGMFLEAQGYNLRNSFFYQDNKSAILMEKNGRNSCTGNSRHVNVRYFFIKDRSDKGEIKIKYCPTNLMIADFFTKPLQGNLFKRLKGFIMGHIGMEELIEAYGLPQIKERVG